MDLRVVKQLTWCHDTGVMIIAEFTFQVMVLINDAGRKKLSFLTMPLVSAGTPETKSTVASGLIMHDGFATMAGGFAGKCVRGIPSEGRWLMGDKLNKWALSIRMVKIP